MDDPVQHFSKRGLFNHEQREEEANEHDMRPLSQVLEEAFSNAEQVTDSSTVRQRAEALVESYQFVSFITRCIPHLRVARRPSLTKRQPDPAQYGHVSGTFYERIREGTIKKAKMAEKEAKKKEEQVRNHLRDVVDL